MSRIAKGFFGPAVQTQAFAHEKGGGLRFSLGCELWECHRLCVVVYWGFARVENTSCETVSTLTPRIAARSFERLAKDYSRH